MGLKNLFLLAGLLVCCSSKPSLPVKDTTSPVVVEKTSFAKTDTLEESVTGAVSAINSAQSVIDALSAQPAGINWNEFDLDEVMDVIHSGRMVFAYFYMKDCQACNKTEKEIFADKEIISLINDHTYPAKADVIERTDLIPIYSEKGRVVTPTFIIILPNGVAVKIMGYVEPEKFKHLLQKIISVKEGWIVVKR